MPIICHRRSKSALGDWESRTHPCTFPVQTMCHRYDWDTQSTMGIWVTQRSEFIKKGFCPWFSLLIFTMFFYLDVSTQNYETLRWVKNCESTQWDLKISRVRFPKRRSLNSDMCILRSTMTFFWVRMHMSELGQAHRNFLWPCILHRVSLTQAVLRPNAQCVLILEGAPEHPSGP